jgi:hypothetical protein
MTPVARGRLTELARRPQDPFVTSEPAEVLHGFANGQARKALRKLVAGLRSVIVGRP